MSCCSFRGCRTRADAKSRLRAWLEQIARDRARTFQSDVLAAFPDDIDVDVMDEQLDASAAENQRRIAEFLAKFDEILDREMPHTP